MVGMAVGWCAMRRTVVLVVLEWLGWLTVRAVESRLRGTDKWLGELRWFFGLEGDGLVAGLLGGW